MQLVNYNPTNKLSVIKTKNGPSEQNCDSKSFPSLLINRAYSLKKCLQYFWVQLKRLYYKPFLRDTKFSTAGQNKTMVNSQVCTLTQYLVRVNRLNLNW